MNLLLQYRYLVLTLVGLSSASAAGLYYGRGPFFLVLAFSVLLMTISLFWSSLLSLTGEAPLSLEEALGMAAPSAEEERKTAVLRALKDLEYERSVGKVSDEDYRELSAKYRTEAKALLQVVEGQLLARRTRAEELVAERLKHVGVAASPAGKTDDSANDPTRNT